MAEMLHNPHKTAKGRELINPGLLNMLEARAQPWSCSRMLCQLSPARPLSADGGTGMHTRPAASSLVGWVGPAWRCRARAL